MRFVRHKLGMVCSAALLVLAVHLPAAAALRILLVPDVGTPIAAAAAAAADAHALGAACATAAGGAAAFHDRRSLQQTGVDTLASFGGIGGSSSPSIDSLLSQYRELLGTLELLLRLPPGASEAQVARQQEVLKEMADAAVGLAVQMVNSTITPINMLVEELKAELPPNVTPQDLETTYKAQVEELQENISDLFNSVPDDYIEESGLGKLTYDAMLGLGLYTATELGPLDAFVDEFNRAFMLGVTSTLSTYLPNVQALLLV